MIRAGNGQVYRVPLSLLRQIMQNDEEGEEEKEESKQQEESKQ